jgi:hypothetical protein
MWNIPFCCWFFCARLLASSMLQVMWALGFIASRLQICFDERRTAVFEAVSNERRIST